MSEENVWQIRDAQGGAWTGHAPPNWTAEDIARSWNVPVENVIEVDEAAFENARAGRP